MAESSVNWDWGEVEDRTAADSTTWRFTTPGSQWRNGVTERRVRAMKEALDLLMPAVAQNLTVLEFQTVLKKACSSINDRPLGIKRSSTKEEGELLPITHNTLLLGRTSLQSHSLIDADDESKLVERVKFIEEVEENWWQIWFNQIFKDMFPRNKWKCKTANLKPGDICLKGYSATLGRDRYALCRVGEVYPDEEGLVRTVQVWSRPCDSREASLPYRNKKLVSEKMPVQRLVLVAREDKIINCNEDDEGKTGRDDEG